MAKSRIIHWIFEDWWLKLIALIVAVLVWIFARLEADYTKELRLGLDLSLLPQDYVVSSKSIDSVSVEIRGKGKVLIQLAKKKPRILLPLKDMHEGVERLRIGPENVIVPEQLQVKSLDPYQIELKIEPRTKRKIKIIVPVEGFPAKNFAISSIDFDNAAYLYGTREAVSGINQLFSEPLNVDGLSETVERELVIQHPDTAGLFVEPPKVKVKVKVESETTVVMRGLPVRIEGKPVSGQAYLLNKEVELTLKGPVSMLRGISPAKVDISILVSSMTPGDYRVPADISLAPGIRVERSEPAIFRILVR
jgi:YbbR domain-containing protein